MTNQNSEKKPSMWSELVEKKGRVVGVSKGDPSLTIHVKNEDCTYEEKLDLSDDISDADFEELREYIGFFVALIIEDGYVISWTESKEE